MVPTRKTPASGIRLRNLAVSLLVLVYPVTAVTVDHASSTILALLTLGGLVTIFLSRTGPLEREEKLLFFVVLLFVGVSVLSFFSGGMADLGWRKLGRHARLLSVIPIYLLFLRTKPNARLLWYGLSAGALVCGVYAVGAGLWQADPSEFRLDTHWILFGDLALALGVMAFAGLGELKRIHRVLWILPVAALLSGVLAAVLSGTRGAWIAIPALAIVLSFHHRHRWKRMPAMLRIAGAFAVIALGLIVYSTPQTGVRQRVQATVIEVSDFLDEDRALTAPDNRLDMWQAAWRMFAAEPLFGVGLGRYADHAATYAAQGEMNLAAARYSHPHSEYLSSMASRGIPGLFVLAALWLVPLGWHLRWMKEGDERRAALGLAGVLLVTAYAHFGLTEAILDRNLPIAFYALFTTLLVYLQLHGDPCTRDGIEVRKC